MLADVRIVQDKGHKTAHKLFVDGNDMSSIAHSCHIQVIPYEVPSVNIVMYGNVEYEGKSDVKFDYTPETIEKAVIILRNELLKHEDLYEAFYSSILSALKDSPVEIYGSDLTENILKRIIGEE